MGDRHITSAWYQRCEKAWSLIMVILFALIFPHCTKYRKFLFKEPFLRWFWCFITFVWPFNAFFCTYMRFCVLIFRGKKHARTIPYPFCLSAWYFKEKKNLFIRRLRETLRGQFCSFINCSKSRWPHRFEHLGCKYFWQTLQKARKHLLRKQID